MLERVVSFIVIGLFIFSPTIGDWWASSVQAWYMQYLIWILLIVLCFWIDRTNRENLPRG